ncbi:MAG: cell division protein FtsQ/DivIB [Rhodoblastus sp.]|uniref:cell division protein FtsQ/DivIB n=1 Tax=Rhodoblastus sp. TaxID=1962975 RepID=UPI003F98243E
MDGGRRLLRSVNGLDSALAAPRAVFAGASAHRAFSAAHSFVAAPAKRHSKVEKLPPRQRLRQNDGFWRRLVEFLNLPGVGIVLTVGLFAGVGLYGAQLNGQYAGFVHDHGHPRDIAARALGFGVDAVTIAGQIELGEAQILQVAGVNPLQSLLFLDVDDMRQKLLALPLVKNVSVRKLFPDRLVIEVVERQPYALWQKDGTVSIIAADGAPIDVFHDEKFARLPFVVGEGANLRIDEFLGLLAASGDLREKIRAGILVSNRRWTLKMTSGVEVMLPEADPKAAIALLARLEQEKNILEKDVVSLDLRVPGKVYARLTEEAADAREAREAKAHGKGART